MVKINTKIDVDYFFKWFTCNDENKSLGFALTKNQHISIKMIIMKNSQS